MRRRRSVGSLGLLVAFLPVLLAGQAGPASRPALGQSLEPRERKLGDDLRVETIRQLTLALTGKDMEGRGTGQPGGVKAARFVADRMARLGLKPLGEQGGFLQAVSAEDTRVPPEIGGKIDLPLKIADPSPTYNVVGLLEGSDPRLREEAVIYTAHYDGLGKRKDGRIYPGAADNALGVAKMLAIAEVLARAEPRPRRSVIFLSPTAEELGLLGSRYWLCHPTWPLAKVAADLNFDGIDTETYGPLGAVLAIGLGQSTLDATLTQLARDMQLLVLPDIAPDQKVFYRSDHFEFAQRGIPTFYVIGLGFREQPGKAKPKAEGMLGMLGTLYGSAPELAQLKARADRFLAKQYHQPSDEVGPEWNWQGVRTAAVFYLVAGLRVANAEKMPVWLPDSKYNRPRGTPPPAPKGGMK